VTQCAAVKSGGGEEHCGQPFWRSCLRCSGTFVSTSVARPCQHGMTYFQRTPPNQATQHQPHFGQPLRHRQTLDLGRRCRRG
jgi:hypothetical protein